MQKLYHGKNTYLSLREVHTLLKIEFKDSEILTIDADSQKAEKIIDQLYSPSLFSTPKVYFLKRPYSNKEKDILIPNLIKILEDGNVDTIIWEDCKVRSNTKYFKFFKERNEQEEFPELNKRSFGSWAKDEISKYPFTMEISSMQILGERSNFEPERFVNNLKKLRLLELENIDKDALDQTVADTLETDIWKLMDAISNSDKKLITQILEKLLEYKAEPHYILAMIARNLRIAVQTKYLVDNNTNEREIASILKLPPFAIYPVIKSIKNTTQDKILLQYQKLSNLDFEIKTGRIEPTLGLSLFTLLL